jgi:N-carbamoylputrescine amidase
MHFDDVLRIIKKSLLVGALTVSTLIGALETNTCGTHIQEGKTMKVGLVQMQCTKDHQRNLDKAIESIADLADKGANVICLPELFHAEYFCQTRNDEYFKLAETIPGTTTDLLAALAKKFGVTILAPLFEKSAEGGYFNTVAVIGDTGEIQGIYRKMHIPDDPDNGYDEAYYFQPGDLGFKVFDTKHGAISPMVCWDQWFPEGARMCAVKGAQVLFYPTAIGWPLTDRHDLNVAEHEAWQTIQRSHAIANNVFVVAVNRVGLQDGLNFWGTSFVADPYGRVLAKASTNKEENIVVDCPISTITSMRKDWPFLDYRRVRYEHPQ